MTGSLDKTVHSPGQGPLLPLCPCPPGTYVCTRQLCWCWTLPFSLLLSSSYLGPRSLFRVLTFIFCLLERTNASNTPYCLPPCPVENRYDYQQHGVLFLLLKIHLKLKLITIKNFISTGSQGVKPPRRARLHFHDKIQSTCRIAQAGLELAQGGQAGLRLAH